MGPTFERKLRKRPEVISYLSRRRVVRVGSTSDLQQLSCTAPAWPVSLRPQVTMPAVSPVAQESVVHLPVFIEQPPLVQSALAAQALPIRHFAALVGAPPPQSMSLSVPFLSPSVVDGGSQTFAAQSTLSQSF